MSGVEEAPAGREHPRGCVPNTPTCTGAVVATMYALVILAASTRGSRSKRKLFSLQLKEKQDLYDRAARLVLDSRGQGHLTYMQAADRIAHRFGIAILDVDRSSIKASISNRVQAKNKLNNILGRMKSPHIPARMPRVIEPTTDYVSRVNNRKGACGIKRKLDCDLPSNKLKKPFKGAVNHMKYQEVCKLAADNVVSYFIHEGVSLNEAVREMHRGVTSKGVEICLNTCMNHVKATLDNNG